MDSSSLQHQRTVSRKIWTTAANTLLSAMESILLDEDLQSLWPREQRNQDLKKKIYTPPTPTLSTVHDPTFSPPLKRKHEPIIYSERETKSQRMTDHLTAQLATRLHVSQSDHEPIPTTTHRKDNHNQLSPQIEFNLTLPNRQKQQRRLSKDDLNDEYMMDNDLSAPASNITTGRQLQQDSIDPSTTPPTSIPVGTTTTPGGRKYRAPTRNRSGPSTPVGSHPPSPSSLFSYFPARLQSSHLPGESPNNAGMSRPPMDTLSAPYFPSATTNNSTVSDSSGQPPVWPPIRPQHHMQQTPLPSPSSALSQGLGIVPDAAHHSFSRGSRLGSATQSTSTSSLTSSASSSPVADKETSPPALPHHPPAKPIRLALFHRLLEASASDIGRTLDINTWITRQADRHHIADRAVFEQTLMEKVHLLDNLLMQLHDLFVQKRPKTTAENIHSHGLLSGTALWAQDQGNLQNHELSYSVIQRTADEILELAHWLCGPDFEMDLGRLCPRWAQHASSLERIVHYVQVVESMRETVSGQFHHPIDLAVDLAHCQEVIDYQRALFGEVLRTKGLGWRALGLPTMEPLIESTQLWVLHLAKVITVKVQAEVHLAIHYYQQQLEDASMKEDLAVRATGGQQGQGIRSTGRSGALELEKCPEIEAKMADGSRSMAEVMELVLQGAQLTNSCLELAGLPCPMLVTSWLTLATPYCWYALTCRQQFIAKMSTQQQNKASMKHKKQSRLCSGSTVDHTAGGFLAPPPLPPPGISKISAPVLAEARMSRGSFLKTMALFENVSRLLQYLMEMREGEEMLIQQNKARQGSIQEPSGNFDNSGFVPTMDSDSLDELVGMTGGIPSSIKDITEGDISTASSDQDDAMDGVTIVSSSSPDHASTSSLSASHHYSSRSSPFSSRRKSPLTPGTQAAHERLKATEELAAILVEVGLELCSSMAEALGQGWHSSTPTTLSSFTPTRTSAAASSRGLSLLRTGDASNPFAYGSSLQMTSPQSTPLPVYHSANTLPASATYQHQLQQQHRNRGAVAVATLTALGGGGAMASGSGGIGLIYVQFVVRFLTKIIEFSGVDSVQDQRLVRIHASLQNLEATLSAS